MRLANCQPDDDSPVRRERRIAAVEHSLDVIMLLSHSQTDLSLTTIAEHVGMSKSAAYELLRTLEARQFITRDPDSRRYRLSWTLYEVGASVLHRVALPSAAAYYLDLLAVQTGLLALLGIVKDESVLYLVRGEAPPGLGAVANIGRRFPLHSTASGKVLLAFHHDSTLMELILHGSLERITSATITDPRRLRAEIARIRETGYATCWQEGEPGLSSIAMPVRDHRGHTVAALALVGSPRRLNMSSAHSFLRPLRTAVVGIETRLGLVNSPDARDVDATGRLGHADVS